MQYDAMEYSNQLDELRKKNDAADDYESWAERACKIKKADRISPVYTLCLYHGEEIWDDPRSLRDMMNLGEDADGIGKMFADYPMHLYCLNEENDFEVFHTEIKKLFEVARYRKDKRRLRQMLEEDARMEVESLLATLMSKLFADNRTEDAKRAANDETIRKQLYREYGIMD